MFNINFVILELKYNGDCVIQNFNVGKPGISRQIYSSNRSFIQKPITMHAQRMKRDISTEEQVLTD